MGSDMKKRRITWVICLLTVLIMLSACSALPDEAQRELPQLYIGIVDYPPYSYKDIDGEYAGIDVELATEACARLGYEPVFKELNISQRDQALADGDIDCLWTCLTMTERKGYQWAGPYLYTRRVIAVASDSVIHDLSDLEGKTLGIQAGSTSEMIIFDPDNDLASRLGLKRINAYSDIGTVFTALRKGYVDAIAGHEGSLNSYISEYPDKFRYLDMSLERVGLGVAFTQDADHALVQSLTDVLNEMTQDGTTAGILSAHGLDVETNLYEVE